MPNVEQALNARNEQKKLAQQQKAEDARKAALEPQARALEQLDRLSANTDFQFFVEEYLTPFAAAAKAGALDIAKSPAERNDQAQRYFIAEKMLGCLEAARETLGKAIS